MTELLCRASLRFYVRHPWQLALAIAGISLGVAVFVGVSLANDSAARAFDAAAQRVRGPLTHRLVHVSGYLDESIYLDIALNNKATLAAPVIEGSVEITGLRGRIFPFVGFDPLQGGRTGRYRELAAASGDQLTRLLTERGAVLLPQAVAAELGLGVGASFELAIGERIVNAVVVGMAPDVGLDGTSDPPLLADIATAQEILMQHGRISYIDLAATASQARALTAGLPRDVLLMAVDGERSAFQQLTAAFRTNLTALGLLALVVGTFLIYGTMSFAVVQRAATLGVLKALGVTGSEILGSVLAEAVAIGAAATLVGLALGHVLALGLVDLVVQTIGDLSFSRVVRGGAPSPWIYLEGAALGLGATLFAAAKPALEAARAAPAITLQRAALERRAHRGARVAAVIALPLLAVSGLWIATGPSALYAGFAGLFGVLAAGALLTPLATVLLVDALDRAFGQRLGLPARLGIRGATATLSRTGVATAALAVAVATVNGVGLMIHSFRTSLSDWLATTLTADVYIVGGERGGLQDLVASGHLQRLSGVEALVLTRSRSVRTEAHGSITVRAVEPGARGWGITLVDGELEALESLTTEKSVIASERLLFAAGLGVGDSLDLPTPHGVRRWVIAGAYQDFSTGEPALLMSLSNYQQEWDDREISSVGLTLREGADHGVVVSAVESLASAAGSRVRSSAGLKELSLAVFDRTFKVTEVLRVLAGIVAFLGVLSALLAVELERTRELGILRTLGFTPGALRVALLTQTGILGVAAGLAALPIGAGMAALLVHVINRRSFGWSMDLVLAPSTMVAGLLLAVTAAILAGLVPAWRATRLEIATALREE